MEDCGTDRIFDLFDDFNDLEILALDKSWCCVARLQFYDIALDESIVWYLNELSRLFSNGPSEAVLLVKGVLFRVLERQMLRVNSSIWRFQLMFELLDKSLQFDVDTQYLKVNPVNHKD